MRISDWSSDVCSSDLPLHFQGIVGEKPNFADVQEIEHSRRDGKIPCINGKAESNIGVDGVETLVLQRIGAQLVDKADAASLLTEVQEYAPACLGDLMQRLMKLRTAIRSEEHTSELQSLMRISYAVFCLKNKNNK